MFETFHEPRSVPHYFGPDGERASTRYSHCEYPVRKTHAEVTSSIAAAKAAAPPGSYVFIKDMPYYLCNETGKIDPNFLTEVLNGVDIHTFLIRNPEKQISSLHKVSTTMEDSVGWTTFDPAEIGYLELYQLYEAVKEQGKTTVTVDADDLLKCPEEILREYCSGVGIPFSDEMLSWEANEERIVRKFALWEGWHDSAISSTGWDKRLTTVQSSSEVSSDTASATQLPDHQQQQQQQKQQDKEKRTAMKSKEEGNNAISEEMVLLLKSCVDEAVRYYSPLHHSRVGKQEAVVS
jgi:hypothetical protein